MKPLLYSFLFSLFFTQSIQAQEDSLDLDIAAIVYLDSFVVTAKKQGFKVDDFIQLVREDASFYAAFRNIRFLSYQSTNALEFFTKKNKSKAQYQSRIQQSYDGKCRSMRVLEEQAGGNFFKRKRKYRYYTAKMYDRLFFTHGKVCEQKSAVPAKPAKESRMDGYIRELKKLIFKPGEKADVPFIGGKTAIFSPKMAKYYDYSITSKSYKKERDCYVFTVRVKPEFLTKKENKTVIKHLETYFDKRTFQVVARQYELRYATALYDFDVHMEIELTKVGKLYVPEYIHYKGDWDVPAKKPEIATFSIQFFDYL